MSSGSPPGASPPTSQAPPPASSAPPPASSAPSPAPSPSSAPPPQSSSPPPQPSPAPPPSTSAPAPAPPNSTPTPAPQPPSTQQPAPSAPAPPPTEPSRSSVVVIVTSTLSPTDANTSTPPPSNATSSPSTTVSKLPTSTAEPSSGGLSPGGTIAVAVVVPVVSVALIILALLFWWRKRKARKLAEEERKREIEEYRFDPNNDPTLPAIGLTRYNDDTAAKDGDTGYRGWGTTSTSRKYSTNMSSGPSMPVSDNGSQQPFRSGSPLDDGGYYPDGGIRPDSGDSETIGALPASTVVNRTDIHRGPSNASSGYSAANHSDVSDDFSPPGAPPGTQYYEENPYYSDMPQQGPYGDNLNAAPPVIRDVQARRNTRIESPTLIKQLSATPTIPAQGATASPVSEILDPQAALRANKEVFFFRLEREIEKVNVFYLQKEAEFSLRLKTLLDKQRVVQSKRSISNSKAPANFVTLFEGFQQFDGDLNKLQQFVEVNETAVSKILKKWDKTSKSRTKELYLQRAVEVQPCFNRDVLRDLSDRATTARLELEAWAEGENIQFDTSHSVERSNVPEEDDVDLHALHTASAGNLAILRDWISKLQFSQDAGLRVTRIFLAAINDFPDEVLTLLLDTGLVDMHAQDDINERSCLHEAAISGRGFVLKAALERGVDVSHTDVYGRIPLHYACMHGRVEMVCALVDAGPPTVDFMDHDNFTPLIHGIIRDQLPCVEQLLSRNARINPSSESDHIPLNLACQHASLPIIRMLLERNAELLPDAEGLYPQHLVARSCRAPDVILLLRDHGADLDQKDKLYQWTPLFHAASEGCVACLRTLLDSGVDADALDEKNLPAMYYAVWEGHLECMILLWSRKAGPRLSQAPPNSLNGPNFRDAGSMTSPTLAERPGPGSMEGDGIPDLSLPPPIIPLRRYGHNFLDNKTFIQICFDSAPSESIVFYQAGRYAAARLAISSKLSDLIPRNIMLPLQEDSRVVSFQIDRLDTFALEFEIFPTFGSKVIAKTVALPNLFSTGNRSSGACCLPLFDPRLRPIGEIKFCFQVIKPYYGEPLEITHFATYWKATSALDSDHNGQITGSSLSGDYVQLFIQLTRDNIPVLCPEFTIKHHGIEIPVCRLTYDQFKVVGRERHNQNNSAESLLRSLEALSVDDLAHAHRLLATSFLSLQEVLAHLSTNIHVNLCILYPSATDENEFSLGPPTDVNIFADSILTEVFNHARASKENNPYFMRSVVFTSYNPNICIALNWKQPNYPVLLCNDLGQIRDLTRDSMTQLPICCSGRASMSVKEAARIAQGNNFMGLMCRSSLLNVMPALIESVKEQGLVLVADTSDESGERSRPVPPMGAEWAYRMPTGVNGVMRGTGILRFNDTIDM
ncbi:phosphate system positive regulatory protein pho81 [Ophidiomyces ophidiicola]|nr:phosphate system positive regulatory protein pho81 [Ophidiomyces ophidiicola]